MVDPKKFIGRGSGASSHKVGITPQIQQQPENPQGQGSIGKPGSQSDDQPATRGWDHPDLKD